jgi:argininosuccinate lyase
VRKAVDSGRQLSELSLEEIRQVSDALDEEYYDVLGEQSWLESKVSEGGTALTRVREQLAHARAELEVQPA